MQVLQLWWSVSQSRDTRFSGDLVQRTNGIVGGLDDCSFFKLMLLPPTRPSVTARKNNI